MTAKAVTAKKKKNILLRIVICVTWNSMVFHLAKSNWSHYQMVWKHTQRSMLVKLQQHRELFLSQRISQVMSLQNCVSVRKMPLTAS